MGKQHNSFKKDIDLLSEAYTRVHHPTPVDIINEGINKLSNNGKAALRYHLHQEGILGAILGAGLGSAAAPGLAAGLLGAPGIGGALAGGYLGHKVTEDNEARDKTGHLSDHELYDAAEDAGTSGPKLLARAREELKDGSLDDDTRDALARDVYAHWAHGDPHAKDHLSEDEEEIMEGVYHALKHLLEEGGGAAAVPGIGYAVNAAGDEEDVSAFAVGDIVYGNDGEEVVVDIEQGTVFTMELGKGGNMYGDHPNAAPIEELSKIDISTDFVEDQESDYYPGGYENHMNRLGAEHGFTGSGKGHATD